MKNHPFLFGFLLGIVFWSLNVSWIFSAINFYGAGIFVSLVISAVLISYLSLYFGFFSALCSYYWTHKYFVLIAPSAFFLLEFIRSYLMTGIPWLKLGMISEELWGMLPIVGIAGTSFLIVFGVALIAKSKERRVFIPLSGVIFLSLVFGPGHFQSNENVMSLKTAVIQPVNLNLDKLIEVTNKLDVDVVVWPEAVTQLNQNLEINSDKEIIGGFYTGDEDIFNSIVNLRTGEKTDKRNLVPFGEFQPFGGLLNSLSSFFVNPYFKSLSPGAPNQANVSVQGHEASGLICWELVFDSTFLKRTRNASMIFHVSNDSWYGDAMPLQHYKHVKARAVESNKWIARSTKDGISSIVSPSLSYEDKKLIRGKDGYIIDDIYLNTTSTVFLLFGNWPLIIFSSLVLLMVILQGKIKE
ncbi:MAG: apolipoprotein N-acyltransferase [Proteobacteria bacterium]|uniref:Apolipoprotein N-acyltransferase n=1 Tax=SAR86 cluster bacterium TaxID=2030880 RepID=A0A937LI91_9GAMM|nr:apolipoprotein N-acyltransferase [SAR86 cluster bacterium]MBL6819925.1 apolipoprotein N-acyltransferase [SAR86 cluster bacterium]MDA0345236.1 apolipoprotein N-acyltransferase [Pseudomonadota bacterium]MDA1056623.1 apolipoprotein N-acyltransferase [Pseudomonadota bacterium]